MDLKVMKTFLNFRKHLNYLMHFAQIFIINYHSNSKKYMLFCGED